MATIDLSTIIYRAHIYGDATPHPTGLGASGSGSKIRLHSIKFRAWMPRNFVDIIVEPPGDGNPGGPGVPPGENPGGPGGGGPPPGTSPPDFPPGSGGGGSGGSGVPPTGGAIAGGGPNTSVSDNFNNNDLHLPTWDIIEEINGTIIENNNQLEFTLFPTATNGSILVLRSDRFYSVYDSTWGFRVPVPGTSPTVWTFTFTETGQGWGWNALTNTLTAYTINGTQIFSYGTAPLYYRIRHVPSAYQFPFPSVVDTHKTAATADFVIDLPPGIQTDDLLIVGVAVLSGSTSFGWPVDGLVGFTSLGAAQWKSLGAGNTGSTHVETAYRFVAAGIFTGINDTITISHTSVAPKVAFAYLIKGAHETTAPQATTTGAGSTNANPPSLTPTWGAENNLWIIHASTGSILPSALSAGYIGQINDMAAGNTVHSTGYKQLNAVTEDPAAFTSASANWRATTIAVRPITTAYYGMYYYEVSDDGSDWTTLYSEAATEAPGLGQFEITVTRPAGTGNDVVAFDDFFLERWYVRPIIKISVPVAASSAIASITAPTNSPHNVTIVVPGFGALASAYMGNSLPIIIALSPGTITAPIASAKALVGDTSSATILISEVVAAATAAGIVPTIITTDGVVEKNIFHVTPNAIASVRSFRSTVTISEVGASASASVIRPQLPPEATITITSTASLATASVAMVVIVGTAKVYVSPVAFATASVDAPIAALVQIKPTIVTATASVSTVVVKVAILPVLPNATASSVAAIPKITVASVSTAIAVSIAPLQLSNPNIIVMPAARARALNSPSPRIENNKPVASAIASITTPLLIGTTKIRIPPAAEAVAFDTTPIILTFDAISSPEAEAIASVVEPNIMSQPQFASAAIAGATINAPIISILVTTVATASGTVITHIPEILVTTLALATASVTTPIVDNGVIEEMLAFPEDPTDELWAGNLDGQSFDDTMPHT